MILRPVKIRAAKCADDCYFTTDDRVIQRECVSNCYSMAYSGKKKLTYPKQILDHSKYIQQRSSYSINHLKIGHGVVHLIILILVTLREESNFITVPPFFTSEKTKNIRNIKEVRLITRTIFKNSKN
ncbi:hypothetical protein LOAG_02374 [Loa loa]|uniref:Uncharacterized protein n=1 Tax=Loa loa TaxID=7209 RepID=A0A1S0U751_LOALO|nr:hypothetical protein LOAG_02374 [Loa loa]EFO26106.1 hypothetical protein LOAG_02374 [Loa loa]